MEQHPVPQQISAYEFRLVGDMTLKQFGQVAGGVIISLLFYASHLPFFIKWPMVILPTLLGVSMAFFPIEERPIHIWIMAFFKAVYSPTQYLWQKKPKVPEILAAEKILPQTTPQTTPSDQPKGEKKMISYLGSLPRVRSEIEIEEERFIDRVQRLFSSLSLSPKWESKIPEKMEHFPQKEEKKEEEEPAGIKVRTLHGPILEVESQPEPEKPKGTSSSASAFYNIPMPARAGKKRAFQQAEFGEIPMPSTPTIPNIIVGMVTDRDGKIVEGAIIEIRDQNGNPVRAFKTNRLGQFQVVTPLPNDDYEIEIEKEDQKFDLYHFTLNGTIVEPIKIRAK